MTARGERGGWQDVWHRMAPRCDRESTSRSGGARPARRRRGHTVGVPRTDPTDTGGLFIGRRPGTGPVRYEVAHGGARRPRVDEALAAAVLALEALVVLSVWGPQPVAWLWVGSQVEYRTGSVSLALLVAFAGMLAGLMATLVVAAGLDETWRALRRAAGHDQREGVLVPLFAAAAVVGAVAFLAWFLVVQGPAPSFAPR